MIDYVKTYGDGCRGGLGDLRLACPPPPRPFTFSLSLPPPSLPLPFPAEWILIEEGVGCVSTAVSEVINNMLPCYLLLTTVLFLKYFFKNIFSLLPSIHGFITAGPLKNYSRCLI